MTLALLCRFILTIAVASAIGWYALRGFLRGRILLGIREGIETWGDRQRSPEHFWFGVVAVTFIALGVLYVGLGPLWGAR